MSAALQVPRNKLDKAREWHRYHIGAAMHAATKSKDPSTKVGCVLVGKDQNVLSTGYNGFARNVREEVWGPGAEEVALRWGRPRKYHFVVHAEQNAILNAARHGVRLDGCIAYLNFSPCCCTQCANALVQVGCRMVVGPNIDFPGVGAGQFYDTNRDALIIFEEAKIQLLTVKWGSP